MSISDFYNETLAATITIGSSNNSLSAQAVEDIRAITVLDDVTAPSMFTLELDNWDGAAAAPSWSDDKNTFFPGQKVSISLGYVGQQLAVPIIEGEITSLEPIFRPTPSTMIVRGYDLRHRLLRGRKTKTFTNVMDSAMAQKIIGAAGVAVQATASNVVHPYVVQHNQTDFAFLQERANRIGFELVAKGKTILFRPRPIDKQAEITLTLGTDIIEFTPRLTTMAQVSEVVVKGWDITKKAAIVGTAKSGKEKAALGATLGPKATNSAFGSTSASFTNSPVFNQAEADQMAIGRFNEMALDYIGGEGICRGRSDLKAGTIVAIEGMGDRYSGSYYITSVKHIWIKGGDYQLYFTYKRNAN
ncbi:MAG: phage late control D family protein [Aestuariibacter sp.]|nr:phage late control D family protein [Aestuariibacter sp.]